MSSAGDVNGDGFDDLIVGAPQVGGFTGESYVVFGGDLSGAVTQLGTAAAETLTGTTEAERLIGAQGNDSLVGGGGADVLAIADPGFFQLDGGTGEDTLRLDGVLALDLTAIPDTQIQDIEAIDLGTGDAGATLTLDLLEVLNISSESNRLLVTGDASDRVDVGSFTDTGDVTIGGIVFDVFTDAANTQAELLIQQGITIV